MIHSKPKNVKKLILLGKKFVLKSKLSWTLKKKLIYYDIMYTLWEKKIKRSWNLLINEIYFVNFLINPY